MARFFLRPEEWGERLVLRGAEAKHCSRVLRAKKGDRIEVFDGAGRRASAVISVMGAREVELEPGEVVESPAIRPEIVLIPAVLKGKAMEWLIQKAVEIGVSAIMPVTTTHAVVRPGEGKEEKWRRTALEACKQCGQDRIPEISSVAPLEARVAKLDHGLKLVASLTEGHRSLREALREVDCPPRVFFLVGPEGDFSDEETKNCLQRDFQPVGLGSQVLRAETAAIFGISAIRYEYSPNF